MIISKVKKIKKKEKNILGRGPSNRGPLSLPLSLWLLVVVVMVDGDCNCKPDAEFAAGYGKRQASVTLIE